MRIRSKISSIDGSHTMIHGCFKMFMLSVYKRVIRIHNLKLLTAVNYSFSSQLDEI